MTYMNQLMYLAEAPPPIQNLIRRLEAKKDFLQVPQVQDHLDTLQVLKQDLPVEHTSVINLLVFLIRERSQGNYLTDSGKDKADHLAQVVQSLVPHLQIWKLALETVLILNQPQD